MAVNDSFAKAADDVSDAGDLIVDGSGAGTSAVLVTEMGATGDCDIYREVDTAGDGSWAVSVKIETLETTWHTQGNDLLCSVSKDIRLRISNVSGGSIDIYTSGYEVDD